MSGITKAPKARKRRARCKQVLVILNNRIEMVELLREEVHPAWEILRRGRWHLPLCAGMGWRLSFPSSASRSFAGSRQSRCGFESPHENREGIGFYAALERETSQSCGAR